MRTTYHIHICFLLTLLLKVSKVVTRHNFIAFISFSFSFKVNYEISYHINTICNNMIDM